MTTSTKKSSKTGNRTRDIPPKNTTRQEREFVRSLLEDGLGKDVWKLGKKNGSWWYEDRNGNRFNVTL